MHFLHRVSIYLQVLLRTMHEQVCTLDRCCEHQRTHFHALYRMCICDGCRYICIYICIGICVYIYVYVHVCAYVYVNVSIYVRMCMCIYMYTYMYVYACMRVYVYMHMCVCVCIYTGPCIFLRRVCMYLQVLLRTMHV